MKLENGGYKLTDFEQDTLNTIEKFIEQAENHLDYLKKSKAHFEAMLLDSIDDEESLYDGEYWECEHSPLKRCIYKMDDSGELICIFCGEPEERK